MQTIHHVRELRSQIKHWRSQGENICLVPTMGNLHAGHLALVERARQIADRVVVSIFVNPMQFVKGEDFATYPRTLEQDSVALADHNVDSIFAPNVDEVYPAGLDQHTEVCVPALDGMLCGAYRPGHFTGVATVVSKLFNLVQPDLAIFGEKDFQQVLVIKRMVADLCMPVEILTLPTVREEDGLAMSSRNGYLSATDRALAPAIYAQLKSTADQLIAGERDFTHLQNTAINALSDKGFEPEYYEIRRQDNLLAPQADDHALVILLAARLGTTRLIDNLTVNTQNQE